jgi:acyl transferase domain-containing protein/surfactin synthase thioesterase subunit
VAHARHPALVGDTASLPYIGNDKDFLATRVSYKFNLVGPSVTVQTACSTSLVAVHLACQSLLLLESDMALAGASTVRVPHVRGYVADRSKLLSRDGRCRPFNAGRHGLIFGSGVAAVAMKRLDDALDAGDPILAVIKGTSITNDGANKPSFTAPSADGQARAIADALTRANVSPDTIGYVECHAAGTAVGDPLEIKALTKVFGALSARMKSCAVGSVKSNIGHPEQTAGLAGLIKTTLALARRELPPTLNYENPNPEIDFDSSPFYVNTKLAPWKSARFPRRAGVNSLGIGGTNAFAVLEEAPRRSTKRSADPRSQHLFTLSAKSEAALAAYVGRISAFLRDGGTAMSGATIADICYTSNVSRTTFAHRIAAVVASRDDLVRSLDRLVAKADFRRAEPGPKRIAFLFTGQGAQHAGMSAALYRSHPTFRKAIDRCDAEFRPHLKRSLRDLMFAETRRGTARLDKTAYTQPALFALEYSLAKLWQSWGVAPSAVIGHSLGEVAAACVAGAMSFEDAVRFVSARGRLMQSLPERGAMAAVFAPEQLVREALPSGSGVVIAATNGPQNTVISGEKEAVRDVIAKFAAAGVEHRALSISNGFHSPLVDPLLDDLEAAAADVAWTEPRIPFISNLTGRPQSNLDKTYWREHTRFSVRFAEGIRACAEIGCDVFLEIGPGSTLLGLASQVLIPDRPLLVPSLSRQKPDWQAIQEALQTLFLAGVPIEWEAVHRGAARRRLALPTYPFERKRCWVDDVPNAGAAATAAPLQAHRDPDHAPPAERLERHGHLTSTASIAVLRREHPVEGATVAIRPLPEMQSDPLPDWLYRIDWRERPPAIPATRERATGWLLFGDQSGVGKTLAAKLTHHGGSCHVVRPGEAFGRTRSGEWIIDPANPDHHRRLVHAIGEASERGTFNAVHLWALDSPSLLGLAAERIIAAESDLIGSVVLASQAIGDAHAAGEFSGRLHLVTRNAQHVVTRDPPSEALQAMLWGFGRSFALEHRELWGGLIDLPAMGKETDADAELLASALREPDDEDQIAIRDGRRLGARLTRIAPPQPDTEATIFRPDATYLIAGGLGMIGLKTARWLVESKGVRSLVLSGRSGARGAAAEIVESLRRRGARVQVVAADVGIAAEAEDLVAGLRGLPPLRGVIHAAGVLDNATVAKLDRERFARVTRPKVAGAWHLHRCTLGIELDFFVLHSSMLSLIGSVGQANYTAANAFLDSFGSHRRALGLPASVINWTAWAEAGLATTAGRRNEDAWRAMGLSYLSPDHGMSLFGRLMDPPVAQAAVAIADWQRYARHVGRRPALLVDLAAGATPTPAQPGIATALREAANDTSKQDPRDALIARVRRLVEEQMGFHEPIDSRQPLSELGLDSLMSASLASRLESSLGIAVPVARLIGGPSVERLVDEIASELLDDRPTGPEHVSDAAEAEHGRRGRIEDVRVSRVEGDSWLVFPRPNPAAKLRLFCFPYAGGNSSVFRPWIELLRDDIELIAVDPPGRAARVHERAFDDYDAFFAALLPAMAPFLDRPVAFYGHCLGGITLYEAARRLRRQPGFDLRHMFVSSARAPQRLRQFGKFEEDLMARMLTMPGYKPFLPAYRQADDVFAELIRRFNIGASEEFLANDELKRLLMPAIRAEFRMASRYRFEAEPAWTTPISCFVGAEDPYVSRQDALAWSEHTRNAFKLHLRDGDHFLVVDDREFIIDAINRDAVSSTQ